VVAKEYRNPFGRPRVEAWRDSFAEDPEEPDNPEFNPGLPQRQRLQYYAGALVESGRFH